MEFFTFCVKFNLVMGVFGEADAWNEALVPIEKWASTDGSQKPPGGFSKGLALAFERAQIDGDECQADAGEFDGVGGLVEEEDIPDVGERGLQEQDEADE